MEHQELIWQQSKNTVTIEVSTQSNEAIIFSLEPEIINFLAGNTPKFYEFFIKLKGENEKSFFVDFNNLKPVASSQSKLRITITKKNNFVSTKYRGIQEKGRYSIARGESFYERYLSETGWIRQKNYFNLYDYSEVTGNKTKIKKEPIKVDVPLVKETLKVQTDTKKQQASTEEQTETVSKKCISCSEIIPDNYDVCPYCSTQQTEAKEKNVDIVL